MCFEASKQLPASLKKEISGFIWHNFVIQTVKLSLFEENIVYKSFLVAPFTEVTFLLREKVVIRNAPASRCLFSFEASKQLPASLKKEISGFIWHNFVIQTVKLSLFEENIVYQSFLVAPFTEVTFLLREKVVIRNAPASRCLLSLKSSEWMDSFTERVTKSLERMDVFTKRVIKSFERMSVFTKRVTKSFERMSVFTERVTKSFERLDVSTERVIKPFERMQIFLNG